MFGHLSEYGYMWGYFNYQPPYVGAPGGIRTHNRLIRSQTIKFYRSIIFFFEN